MGKWRENTNAQLFVLLFFWKSSHHYCFSSGNTEAENQFCQDFIMKVDTQQIFFQ